MFAPVCHFQLRAPIAALVALTFVAPAVAQPLENTGIWEVTGRDGVFIEDELITLSPDGQWIAGIDMDNAFCVWELATGDATCAGADLDIDRETIRWAPDSTAVAFSHGPLEYAQDTDIFVFERETGVLTNLTDDGYEGTSFSPEIDALPVDLYPNWSADSQTLTFIRCDVATTDRLFTTELVSIPRAGGEPVQR